MVMSVGDRVVKKRVLFLEVYFCDANEPTMRYYRITISLSVFPLNTTATNQLVLGIFSTEVDSKTGRRQQILMDFCGQKRGILSVKRTLVNAYGWVMPVERFEPSTPHGDLFLRQARIPFRHTGS